MPYKDKAKRDACNNKSRGRWRLRNIKREREKERTYAATHKEQRRLYAATHRQQRNAAERARGLRVKIEVLSHYGPEGKLKCCWSACEVTDPDMLTADHVNNDGKKHREAKLGGISLYLWLRRNHFPSGFQTLCHNHQWKKEILRLRGKAA